MPLGLEVVVGVARLVNTDLLGGTLTAWLRRAVNDREVNVRLSEGTETVTLTGDQIEPDELTALIRAALVHQGRVHLEAAPTVSETSNSG